MPNVKNKLETLLGSESPTGDYGEVSPTRSIVNMLVGQNDFKGSRLRNLSNHVTEVFNLMIACLREKGLKCVYVCPYEKNHYYARKINKYVYVYWTDSLSGTQKWCGSLELRRQTGGESCAIKALGGGMGGKTLYPSSHYACHKEQVLEWVEAVFVSAQFTRFQSHSYLQQKLDLTIPIEFYHYDGDTKKYWRTKKNRDRADAHYNKQRFLMQEMVLFEEKMITKAKNLEILQGAILLDKDQACYEYMGKGPFKIRL